MRHAGILAHSVEGASLCLRAFCQEGFRTLGPHEHPDVTLDCIALGRSMAAWQRADYAAVRLALAESATRLARAGTEFFFCPDNTAHIALEQPGPALPLPALHIAEIIAGEAARRGTSGGGRGQRPHHRYLPRRVRGGHLGSRAARMRRGCAGVYRDSAAGDA